MSKLRPCTTSTGFPRRRSPRKSGSPAPNVSRVLAEARRSGIITISITITDPIGRAAELEHELRKRFGLRDARVVRGSDDDLQRVGRLGADWLVQAVEPTTSISLSWGSAVQAVVEAVQSDTHFPDVEVLPLVGGLSIVDSEQDGNVLVRELANRLGARDRRLNAPALVESVELCDALLREPSIASVLDDAAHADVAVVGVGAVGSGSSAAIVDYAALPPRAAAAFMASGAVGDCCTRYYDSDGKAVDSPLNHRVVAVDLAALRNVETVVAVAAGSRKTESIGAGLRGGLFDVLVVDEPLAHGLLNRGDR